MQRGVARTATADQDLGRRRAVVVDRLGDAARGEREQRRLDVDVRHAAAGEPRVEPAGVEEVASGALRRREPREYGSDSSAASSPASTRPRRAQAPSRRTARRGGARATGRAARCRDRCRSRAPCPRGGRSVTLAMPPTLTTTRWTGPPNSAAWNAGTSGAPWPPAATSRLRKSATTVMPQRSATRAGLLSCSVQPSSGRWRIVWPWTPAATIVAAPPRPRRAAACDDRVRVEVGERIGGARGARELVGAGCLQREELVRQRGGERQRGGSRAPERPPAAKSATTASTPSRLVPDITPA